MYDTLKDGKKEKEYHALFSKYNMYRYFYWSAALLAAGFLAHYFGTIFVVFLCIGQRAINTILGIFIKEPVSSKNNKTNNSLSAFQHLHKAFKEIMNNRRLLFVSLTRILKSGFIFGIDRFNATFYKLFISFKTLGFLTSGSIFLHAFIAKYAEKYTKKVGFLNTLLTIEYIAIPLQIVSYLFPGAYSPFVIEASLQTNPLSNITENALLQKQFTDHQRATMESVIEIFGTLFFAIFTALIGYLADIWSLPHALLFGVICRITLIPLLFHTFKK